MASIITDLKENFRRGGTHVRLVYINVAVFLVAAVAGIVLQLFNVFSAGFLQWFELPASFARLAVQPWSAVTYMFLHANLWHLLFNMLWLYWFGSIFLQFFSARHLRGLYLLAGLCGGLLYMLSYNVFPYFRLQVDYSFLLGASASVLGIVAAAAYREPNYPIQLLLIGAIRLKYLALVVIGLDVLSITASNAGGHIAHLGGALAGLWWAVALNKGTDLTRWINRAADALSSLFRPRPRKPKMKVHYGAGRTDRQKDYDYNARRKAENDEIDRILDKLRKSGYESLSTEEKKRLFEAGNR